MLVLDPSDGPILTPSCQDRYAGGSLTFDPSHPVEFAPQGAEKESGDKSQHSKSDVECGGSAPLSFFHGGASPFTEFTFLALLRASGSSRVAKRVRTKPSLPRFAKPPQDVAWHRRVLADHTTAGLLLAEPLDTALRNERFANIKDLKRHPRQFTQSFVRHFGMLNG